MASRARAKLEKAYEELLSTNENLLEELTNVVQQKKRLEVERAEIFQANDDLFAETERLNVEEAKWEKERSELTAKILDLSQLVENLRLELKDRTESDARDAEIGSLRNENSGLAALVTRLEADNENLVGELKRAAEMNTDLQKVSRQVSCFILNPKIRPLIH